MVNQEMIKKVVKRISESQRNSFVPCGPDFPMFAQIVRENANIKGMIIAAEVLSALGMVAMRGHREEQIDEIEKAQGMLAGPMLEAMYVGYLLGQEEAHNQEQKEQEKPATTTTPEPEPVKEPEPQGEPVTEPAPI